MIKIYGTANGSICRIAQTDDIDELFVRVPDATSSLVVDVATNAALATDFVQAPQNYTLLAGVLYKSGERVTINPPGPDTTDAQNQVLTPVNAQGAIDTLTTGINAWDGLSAAQRQTLIVNNFKLVMQILRGLLRVALWLTRR